MIITSIPRSGSTKFTQDYAIAHGLKFYDEILEPLAPWRHKNEHHESRLSEFHPKDPTFLRNLDFDSCVINNHDMNYFVLLKTDIFVSRQNIQDSVWSYIAYTDLLIQTEFNRSSPDLVMSNTAKLFKKIEMFLAFCAEFQKEIVIPQNIQYRDTLIFRDKFSWMRDQVDQFGSYIKLPNGFSYD